MTSAHETEPEEKPDVVVGANSDEPTVMLTSDDDADYFSTGTRWQADGEPKAAYYGLGWMIRPVGDSGQNIWHGGSLPGTNTLLVYRHDGLTWAVLFNTRDIPGPKDPVSLIDPLLHRAADAVEQWPEHDLWDSAMGDGD